MAKVGHRVLEYGILQMITSVSSNQQLTEWDPPASVMVCGTSCQGKLLEAGIIIVFKKDLNKYTNVQEIETFENIQENGISLDRHLFGKDEPG